MLFMSVVSLIDGSTTGVLMSPRYGGYQTATPPPYYPKATYATTSYCTEVYKYYTTKASEFCTITYAAPSHYTDALKCYSALSYCTTKATEYYMSTHAAPSYYNDSPNCYTEAPADYSTKKGRILHRSAAFLIV
ncbi:uncharacterized protein LOC124194848 [Daphnia pulex]|uniref:uncharacterized protein LOC124194848 n=1 Tax=Daphnia pulex TaxID=6669 RepID=UPI001EDF90DA|nr:uncharacterized protein LOC124194848 [Daphnia pulex]